MKLSGYRPGELVVMSDTRFTHAFYGPVTSGKQNDGSVITQGTLGMVVATVSWENDTLDVVEEVLVLWAGSQAKLTWSLSGFLRLAS